MSTKSNLPIVILVTMIGAIGIALPYPILSPLFLDTQSQINRFLNIDSYILLGIILAVYPLGLLIGSSYLGKLSDQYGRKPILFWTLLISMITNALSAWAIIQESYLLLFITRFLTGFLEGNIAVARAIVTDLGDKINKTQAFGFVTAAAYSGWFIGPLIGGYLSEYGFAIPFWVATIIGMLGALTVWFKLDVITAPKIIADTEQNSFWAAPGLLIFVGIHFLATFAVNIFYEFYPVYLVAKWQSTPQTIAHATMFCTLAMVICSSMVLKPAEQKLPKIALYILGLAFSGVFIIIFTIPNKESLALTVFFPIGFFIALYNSIAYAWFSDRFHFLQQGRLMGTLVATFCLANFIAALVGGWIASFNITALLVAGGIIFICAALLLFMANSFIRANARTHYQAT